MTDQGKPEGPGGDYDRMSLDSLKRELEVQKGKTELAREEAQERIREGAERRGAPWGLVAGILLGGGLLLGAGWFFRAQLVDSGVPLPDFILPPIPDAGPFVLPELPPPPVRRDAGPAVEEHTRPHGPRRPRDTTRGGRELDFGDTNDPIEGLGGD